MVDIDGGVGADEGYGWVALSVVADREGDVGGGWGEVGS